jgi:hypothetical protein
MYICVYFGSGMKCLHILGIFERKPEEAGLFSSLKWVNCGPHPNREVRTLLKSVKKWKAPVYVLLSHIPNPQAHSVGFVSL